MPGGTPSGEGGNTYRAEQEAQAADAQRADQARADKLDPGTLQEYGIAHDFKRPGERKVKDAPEHTPEAVGQIPLSEANQAAAGPQLSGPQEINKLLAPYLKELTQLGPEYQQEMNFLAPYLSPAHQTFSQIEAGSAADESPTGSKSVNAADAAAGQAIEDQAAPGFGNLAKAGKQYEATVPYQQQLQAGLGYQKYLSTYGGQVANTTNWPTQAAQAYQGVMGAGGAGPGGGLPAITQAASANVANQNLTNTLAPTTQGGGSSTGY